MIMPENEQLVTELKVLRKGRGILAPTLASRVGPALRKATGTTAIKATGALRRKVADSLWCWAMELPEDLRHAVVTAFALDHNNSQAPLYQERVRAVARQLNRDDRTARRRIDDGIERLAEIAVAGGLPSRNPPPQRRPTTTTPRPSTTPTPTQSATPPATGTDIRDIPVAGHATLRRTGFQAWLTINRLDEIIVGDTRQPLNTITNTADLSAPASLELTGFDVLELAAQLVDVYAHWHPTRMDTVFRRMFSAIQEAPFHFHERGGKKK